MTSESSSQRVGCIALIGAPNAGKSTLLNQLVGAKVAIVSPKVQTTRFALRGIHCTGDAQLIYIDTPGIFSARGALDQAMVQAAWNGASEADVIAVLVDVSKKDHSQSEVILESLAEHGLKPLLVLNKIDRIAKPKLLELAAHFNAVADCAETFMVSAMKGDGVEGLERYLVEQARPGPWLYPEDQLTDLHSQLLAAELTRESLFLHTHQELPYGLMVETEKWEAKKDGSVKIWQQVIVEREAHKKIVLGKGGEHIKRIGERSRKEIAKLLDCPVHLFLHVRVDPKWKSRHEHYHAMGLPLPGSK